MLGKMAAGSISEKARQLRALYAFMWAWPGKKTLFMGSEFGQSREWRYDNSLDWHLLQYRDHEGIAKLIRDLNRWYSSDPDLAKRDHRPDGFSWINCHDSENSVFSMLRLGSRPGSTYAIAMNATPVSRTGYRLGLPYPGKWTECLNTDAGDYGGFGAGNMGAIFADHQPWDNLPCSAMVNLPAMSTLIFRCDS